MILLIDYLFCASKIKSCQLGLHEVLPPSTILSSLTRMSFLPGTASLIKEINKELLVVLRDGRTLIGRLKSIDQFANLLLQDAIERIYIGQKYGDIHRGVFLIRGENVVLLGEFDRAADEKSNLEKVSVDEILEAQRSEQIAKDLHEKALVKARLQLGMLVNLPDSYVGTTDDFGT